MGKEAKERMSTHYDAALKKHLFKEMGSDGFVSLQRTNCHITVPEDSLRS